MVTLSVVYLCALTLGMIVLNFFPFDLFSRKTAMTQKSNINAVILKQLSSFIFFVVLPVSLLALNGGMGYIKGIGFTFNYKSLIWTLLLSLILVGINLLNHSNNENLKLYPIIRTSVWNPAIILVSAFGWIVYLFSYELIFRGLLLFSFADMLSETDAILLNVCLYSILHFPKGWKESLGSIPLGWLLCVICLEAGNFFPAFLIHCCMALSNEWLSIKAHPGIKVTWSVRS